MCGFPPDGNSIKYKYTDWVASVRKDVECFFGILKMRFRWLKCPMRLQKKIDIDNAVVVCCMLNNLILSHDGLDTLWESDVNWKTLNPNGNEDDDDEDLEDDVFYHPSEEEAFVPLYFDDSSPQGSTESDNFRRFRFLLAKHLDYTYKLGKLQWPLTRKAIKNRYNEIPRRHFPRARDLFTDIEL
jgi:DDE superfamily endonuclease